MYTSSAGYMHGDMARYTSYGNSDHNLQEQSQMHDLHDPGQCYDWPLEYSRMYSRHPNSKYADTGLYSFVPGGYMGTSPDTLEMYGGISWAGNAQWNVQEQGTQNHDLYEQSLSASSCSPGCASNEYNSIPGCEYDSIP